jgi:hypothetical protein
MEVCHPQIIASCQYALIWYAWTWAIDHFVDYMRLLGRMAGTYNLPGVEIMFWMCLLQYWRFRLLYISVSMSPNLIECSLLCVICTYNLPGVEIMFWMRVFYFFWPWDACLSFTLHLRQHVWCNRTCWNTNVCLCNIYVSSVYMCSCILDLMVQDLPPAN